MTDTVLEGFVKYASEMGMSEQEIASFVGENFAGGSMEKSAADNVDSFYDSFFGELGMQKTDEGMIYADSFIKSAMAVGLQPEDAVALTLEHMREKTAQENPYIAMLRNAQPEIQKQAELDPLTMALLGGAGGAGIGALAGGKKNRGKGALIGGLGGAALGGGGTALLKALMGNGQGVASTDPSGASEIWDQFDAENEGISQLGELENALAATNEPGERAVLKKQMDVLKTKLAPVLAQMAAAKSRSDAGSNAYSANMASGGAAGWPSQASE